MHTSPATSAPSWPTSSTNASGPVSLSLAAPPPSARADQDDPSLRSDRAQRLADQTQQRLLEAATAAPERRQELLDEVVTSHLWLADSLARRFLHRGEEEQDLLQVARAGLVEASRRFDPERGAFLAFAAPTILGVLKRYFRDQGWSVRPPRRTQELAFEIRRGWPTLVQDLGAMPTDGDLAVGLGVPVADVREARYASQGYYCTLLDAATEPDQQAGQAHTDAERLEARLLLSRVWDELDAGERQLIRLRFVEELSQSRIASICGTSQMQVSRCLNRLLLKLRRLIGDEDSMIAS